jgi:hypothetical protein
LESSFVEAGGDSMKAILVASGCQRHGVAITRSQILKAKSIQELVASLGMPLTHAGPIWPDPAGRRIIGD